MKRVIAWILVILWCVVIFFFSAEDKNSSHQRSQQITEVVEKTIEKILEPQNLRIIAKRSLEHYVRKSSHVLEYFILTMLIYNALTLSRIRNYKRYILSFIIAISYACFDEMHQAYVPGRGPMVEDVFVDGVGVLMALAVSHGFFMNRKPIRRIFR